MMNGAVFDRNKYEPKARKKVGAEVFEEISLEM